VFFVAILFSSLKFDRNINHVSRISFPILLFFDCIQSILSTDFVFWLWSAAAISSPAASVVELFLFVKQDLQYY
jgi:hypothetical protein